MFTGSCTDLAQAHNVAHMTHPKSQGITRCYRLNLVRKVSQATKPRLLRRQFACLALTNICNHGVTKVRIRQTGQNLARGVVRGGQLLLPFQMLETCHVREQVRLCGAQLDLHIGVNHTRR